MKVGNKNVEFKVQLTKQGDPILFGLSNWDEECPCCGDPMNITAVGIGIVSFAVCIQNL